MLDVRCSTFNLFIVPAGGVSYEVSASSLAAEANSFIGKATEVSYELHGIGYRAQGVCTRSNLILFVLVLVLGNQKFIEDEGRERGRRRY